MQVKTQFLSLLIGTTAFAQTAPLSTNRTPGQAWTDPATGIELRWIPAGSFTMGSPSDEPGRFDNEDPQHAVRISRGFWMGAFEVTQGQYETVMGANPSHSRQAGTRAPVDTASWDDAHAFLYQLNAKGESVVYSLPTEAQWEYACRAGTTSTWYADLNTIAWYSFNSNGTTHPVGQKQANAWGLYDMLGNVWEWCQDWYGDYPSGSSTDPSGPTSGTSRVLRGGSWLLPAWCSRAACRRGGVPSVRVDHYGFRVVAIPRVSQ
jgi:formylglycine-generating enzyme required for sulfatase activity